MPCGKSWRCLASAFQTPWFWPTFRRRMLPTKPCAGSAPGSKATLRPRAAGLVCPPSWRHRQNRRSSTITVGPVFIYRWIVGAVCSSIPQAKVQVDKIDSIHCPTKACWRSQSEEAQVRRAQGGSAPKRRWEAEAKWYVRQKSYVCDFGEVQSVSKSSNNRLLRQAWTRERISNEDGSRWLIAGHGIQVSMPGILEPYPNQSDECLHRGQFKEGDDRDACKNVQHWNNWGNGAFESRCLQHGYLHQRCEIELCGGSPHPLDNVPETWIFGLTAGRYSFSIMVLQQLTQTESSCLT